MIVRADETGLTVRRSFSWGGLMLADSSTTGPSITGPSVDEGPLGDAKELAIPVRHAADVDLDAGPDSDGTTPPFEVTVVVRVGQAPGHPEQGGDPLYLPSGVLLVGDPEHEDELRLRPGLWRAHVRVEPEDHPEQVWVTLIPA